MNAFQESNHVNQDREDPFSSLLNRTQQSTLWIGNTAETPIAAITIYEMETTPMVWKFSLLSS
jgi:hypothetical protein